jgi:peroxiredoxin
MSKELSKLSVGDTAPDFTMPSTVRGRYTLSEEAGKGPVLLYFYVMNFGHTCTWYIADMIEARPRFQDLGVTMVHVNPASVEEHKEWVETTGSPFEHISDVDQEVSKRYGAIVTNEKAPKVLGYTNREFYLVDEKMIIRYIWCAEMPADAIPIAALLDELKAALR